MRAALILVLTAGVARADEPPGTPLPRRPVGNVSADLEATWIDGASSTYAFGQHAVILPKGGVSVQMEDVVLGGTGDGHFVYQVQHLAGLGHWFGPGGVGLAAGLGVDGITGHRIPIGMRIPVRAWTSWNLRPSVRFEVSGEVAWITFTQPRRGRGAAFGDELVGRAGLYLGGRGREPGCFIGVTARQALDTTLLTFGIGVGLAAAAID